VVLDASDIPLKSQGARGWTGLIDYGTQLLLDVRINEELAGKGWLARLFAMSRSCGRSRVLEMEDRIILVLCHGSPALRSAVEGIVLIYLQKHWR